MKTPGHCKSPYKCATPRRAGAVMQPHLRRRGARLGPSGGPRALGAAEKDPDRCSSAGRAGTGPAKVPVQDTRDASLCLGQAGARRLPATRREGRTRQCQRSPLAQGCHTPRCREWPPGRATARALSAAREPRSWRRPRAVNLHRDLTVALRDTDGILSRPTRACRGSTGHRATR